uniref:Gamma-aminobutyric acid type B receptor subunit 2-like n=1 Tax=Saccoglossus kowalevskii TaxID=10224 RepID=A0ABM0MGV1_SACKO|nr:PREDICTED: gamma-aminobutyric acid type B receptor subunit 2-like [Saccoglossus kowalevskii]
MVGLLVFVDMIVLTLWDLIDPLKIVMRSGPHQEHPTDSDIVIVPVWLVCESINTMYWLGALYAIKGLLLIFGAFLAWETRNVTVPALNDSKYIGASVYNVLILAFVGVAISLLIQQQATAYYALMSMFIFFATTLTQCMVFVPKIKSRNEVQPSGTMLTATWKDSSETQKTKHDKERKLADMAKEIRILKEQLSMSEDRVRDLENKNQHKEKSEDEPVAAQVHGPEYSKTAEAKATRSDPDMTPGSGIDNADENKPSA